MKDKTNSIFEVLTCICIVTVCVLMVIAVM